jgi:hypothetical protein
MALTSLSLLSIYGRTNHILGLSHCPSQLLANRMDAFIRHKNQNNKALKFQFRKNMAAMCKDHPLSTVLVWCAPVNVRYPRMCLVQQSISMCIRICIPGTVKWTFETLHKVKSDDVHTLNSCGVFCTRILHDVIHALGAFHSKHLLLKSISKAVS